MAHKWKTIQIKRQRNALYRGSGDGDLYVQVNTEVPIY